MSTFVWFIVIGIREEVLSAMEWCGKLGLGVKGGWVIIVMWGVDCTWLWGGKCKMETGKWEESFADSRSPVRTSPASRRFVPSNFSFFLKSQLLGVFNKLLSRPGENPWDDIFHDSLLQFCGGGNAGEGFATSFVWWQGVTNWSINSAPLTADQFEWKKWEMFFLKLIITSAKCLVEYIRSRYCRVQ